MVSVIIPTYNEEKAIVACLVSLSNQSYSPLEIIVVDDGSNDQTASKVRNTIAQLKAKNFVLLSQNHRGPALARNLGAVKAKGEILVFVDSDMTFDNNFIKELVYPIEEGKTIGTFSKEEYLSNKNNSWSLCWNINRYLINGWKLNNEVYERILPSYYPDKQPVFRAVKKVEFEKIGGFDSIGYTDDWTLSRKLNTLANVAKGAKYYHRNPETPKEIWNQGTWIGKNEFISGSYVRMGVNLIRYSIISSIVLGFIISLKLKTPHFLIFKIIYDLSISYAIISSFLAKKETK